MFADRNPTIDSETINEKFKEKGVSLPCPRCGNARFSLVGEAHIVLSPDGKPRNLLSIAEMPATIPVIIIGCDNCGFLIQHAKAPLGLSRWQERSPR